MTASIHDVAHAAGVSTATVSRALRGLPGVSDRTREAVRIAAQDLEYVVSLSASNLASGRTRAMGVIVPSVSQWFYTSVVEGIDAVPGVHAAEVTGTTSTLDIEPGAMGDVIAHLAPYGIVDLTSRPPTLEELFLRHYESAADEPQPAVAR